MTTWTGPAIKALRGEESQKAFAERFGVDQSTISLWENGENQPRGPALKILDQIAAEARTEKAA